MKTRPIDRSARPLLVKPTAGGSGGSVPNPRDVRPATAGKDLATRPGLFAADRKVSPATRGKPAAAPSRATGTAAQTVAGEEPLGIRKTSSQEPATATPVTPTRPKAGGKAGATRRKPDAVKDRGPAAKRSSPRKAKARAAAGEVSKKDTVLALLRRTHGATLTELVRATGWQPHSVRGFLSGALRKKMHLKVKSGKRDSGERVYLVRS